MSEKNVTSTQIPEDASNTPSDYRNDDLSQLANTPAPLPDSFQVYPGDDLSHIPTAPIAPPEFRLSRSSRSVLRPRYSL